MTPLARRCVSGYASAISGVAYLPHAVFHTSREQASGDDDVVSQLYISGQRPIQPLTPGSLFGGSAANEILAVTRTSTLV